MIRLHHLSLFLFSFLFYSCHGQKKEVQGNSGEYTNELIHETSPYLLQHAHNPVNWYPWGEKAFARAENENKLVLISIGYAACHWCHVMEHECFEDTSVARLMNDNFVCIKVDREERPDVDQVYMTACQLMTGRGGWPLNALALPDGKPFFAGTYFPKENWIKMLNYFVRLQASDPDSLKHQAQLVTQGIVDSEQVSFTEIETMSSLDQIDAGFQSWKSGMDSEYGGENQAPKFPMPSNWEYLLHYYDISRNEEALAAVTLTLDRMAQGGIYDQVGGGFSRYSTDAQWQVPHFEKMLYDNAQLVSLYSHAYQVTHKELYKRVVFETLDFIEHELSSPKGGFYSSLDADSDGEEGKYYVWTYDEFTSLLPEDAPLLLDYYQVTRTGNWEDGKNVLWRKGDDETFAKNHHLTIGELHERVSKGNQKLLEARNERNKPRLDDKILTSWNALMVMGYLDAYDAFGEEQFKEKAMRSAQFLAEKACQPNSEVWHSIKTDGDAIHGFLDDYAFVISAFTRLYQCTFDALWLHRAKELADYVVLHFADPNSHLLFYTDDQYSELIARKMEINDNVVPSSNAIMAKNFFSLGLYFDSRDFSDLARNMMLTVVEDVQPHIRYYSCWGDLELNYVSPVYEVAIIGPESKDQRMEMASHYLPNVLLVGGTSEGTLPLLKNKLVPGETWIYVCRDKTCQRPVQQVTEALEQMER